MKVDPAEVRIERGAPTDEEVAALVAALSAWTAATPGDAAPPTSRWATSARPGYAYADGRPTRPAGDAWLAGALPR